MPRASFSSLPIDIVMDILARVPKRSHPILTCVSKNFSRLVRSPDILEIRSLLRKDSPFICFVDKTNSGQVPKWFTLRSAENNTRENHFASIDITFPSQISDRARTLYLSQTMWVLDSRTEKVREGPPSIAARLYQSVGVVSSKLYVIGSYKYNDTHVEAFDVKTQTWELAPVPEEQGWWWSSAATVSLNRKVCSLRFSDTVKCYDTRDGSCESLGFPKDKWLWRTGACVMNNVLYVYYARFGLVWYDLELRLWRVVDGLSHLNKVRSAAMAEYYGKLAFLWEEEVGASGEMKEVWCRMISLERSEEGVDGIAAASQLMGSVSRGYRLQHCLSVSD